jgi:hypothetical protein
MSYRIEDDFVMPDGVSGRKMKFPFAKLEVGQGFRVACSKRGVLSLGACRSNYIRKYAPEKRIIIRRLPNGSYGVKRVK